jgi:hypothetical protein
VNFPAQRSTNAPANIGTERRNCSTRTDTLVCRACASFFAAYGWIDALATDVSERRGPASRSSGPGERPK